jgi:hypothetical protein
LRASTHRDECACIVSVSDVLCNSQKNTDKKKQNTNLHWAESLRLRCFEAVLLRFSFVISNSWVFDKVLPSKGKEIIQRIVAVLHLCLYRIKSRADVGCLVTPKNFNYCFNKIFLATNACLRIFKVHLIFIGI